MRSWEKRTSPFPNETKPITSPIKQKQQFYLNKEELKKSPQIKRMEIDNKQMFPFRENSIKSKGNNKLIEELSFT